MGRTRSVLLILMLLAGSLSPPVAAQELRSSPPLERGRTFQLEPNYPNPVSSETFIPFRLDSTLFQNRDSVVVSLRIVNYLNQVQAIPVMTEGPRGATAPIINLAFREPVPAYRHDAAMFLHRRGWIPNDTTHPSSPPRPGSDGPVLDEILDRLDALLP